MLASLVALRDGATAEAPLTGARVRDALRQINDPRGVPVYAGQDGFAEAAKLIADGKAINYEGASGPCDFDENGDVVAQLARFRVEKQQFVDAELYDCLSGPSCPRLRATAQTSR